MSSISLHNNSLTLATTIKDEDVVGAEAQIEAVAEPAQCTALTTNHASSMSLTMSHVGSQKEPHKSIVDIGNDHPSATALSLLPLGSILQ